MEAGEERTDCRLAERPRPRAASPLGDGATQPCHRGVFLIILLAVYAAGLTHGLTRPWIGMHDWNGAFFSQLARNLLRYPVAVHHGMGVVAVGEAVPPPDERCFYSPHPPALIWLVALAFRVFGEAEWAARLVPILASLGSLGLLIWLMRRSYGSETATLAALFYAVSPMTVFFGRMVDHEAVCLFFMLAAMACWQVAITSPPAARNRAVLARIGWIVAIFGAIWVDWPGVLFAGLFSIYALRRAARRRSERGLAVTILTASVLCTTGMLIHLVYGGLDGRFEDLLAVFLSRAANPDVEAVHRGFFASEGPAHHIVGNLTWPMIILAGAGLIRAIINRCSRGTESTASQEAAKDTVESGPPWWVLLATGVVWVCLLWRQFERHNYWMFYVGPFVTIWAAEAVLVMRDRLMPSFRRLAGWAYYAVIVVAVFVALRGTDEYFAVVSYPSEAVSAWRRINAVTGPNDRVLFYQSPVLLEPRGHYLLRNIVPTQQTYYLDRSFGVEKDFSAVAAKASEYSVYVVPIPVALSKAAELSSLETLFPREVLGLGDSGSGYAIAVFDLRDRGIPRL